MHRGKIVSLFDQPVGAVNQLPRQGEAERFGGSEIDNKLAFGGLADLGDGRVSLLRSRTKSSSAVIPATPVKLAR
jgi:hypothetical protein